MKKLALLFALLTGLALSGTTEAASKTRSYSSRSHTTSRGYYRGPAQPSGHYANGSGSSHKGGSYQNSYTGHRYQKRSR